MAFLFDTNIFLEILLNQEKKELCKRILNDNYGKVNLSDFSLHSIGVILLKQNKPKVFDHFLQDILPHSNIVSLQKNNYSKITEISSKYKLDFDDAYQSVIALEFELSIKTMDMDFVRISKLISVKII
jgi:uncharacterized protein